MTKRTRKLNLKKETLKALNSDSLSRAQGGLGAAVSGDRCAGNKGSQQLLGSQYTLTGDIIEFQQQ